MKYLNLLFINAILFTHLTYLLDTEFNVEIEQPNFLAQFFKGNLEIKNLVVGTDKKDYEKTLNIVTLPNNKSGCKKHQQNYSNNQKNIGMLLLDGEICSLSQKIRNAQLAGANVLFLKFSDDDIQNSTLDVSDIEDIRIPVFLVKYSDAQYIYDILNSPSGENKLVIKLTHNTVIDYTHKYIQIFMSSSVINNPVINFLKDLNDHGRLIKNYNLQIQFALGFCWACEGHSFSESEPGCLSGGRYCVISQDFRTGELTKETLRQICIRNKYGNNMLSKYLILMNQVMQPLYLQSKFKERDLETYFSQVIGQMGLSQDKIYECYNQSFVPQAKSQIIDINLDDNKLLKQEQQLFFSVAKYDTFPMIIINKLFYDRSINIREFIKFGCENKLFDCRGFRLFRKIFLFTALCLSIIMISLVILMFRKILRRKMEKELNLKVDEAVRKYINNEKK